MINWIFLIALMFGQNQPHTEIVVDSHGRCHFVTYNSENVWQMVSISDEHGVLIAIQDDEMWDIEMTFNFTPELSIISEHGYSRQIVGFLVNEFEPIQMTLGRDMGFIYALYNEETITYTIEETTLSFRIDNFRELMDKYIECNNKGS